MLDLNEGFTKVCVQEAHEVLGGLASGPSSLRAPPGASLPSVTSLLSRALVKTLHDAPQALLTKELVFPQGSVDSQHVTGQPGLHTVPYIIGVIRIFA